MAATPKALAQDADIIIVMVTGPEAIYELLFGPEGAAAAFNPEQVFINMSSVLAQLHPGVGQRAGPHGHPLRGRPGLGHQEARRGWPNW